MTRRMFRGPVLVLAGAALVVLFYGDQVAAVIATILAVPGMVFTWRDLS